MYSQANVRVESVLRSPTRPLPSVIVDTENVLREADGSTKAPAMRGGWKGVRPGVRLKNRTVRAGRSPKNTSGPIFRATTPLSRCKLKSKGHGKLSIHFAADQQTIETVFRIIVCANQLSLYEPVATMCEEYESLHDRSGQPDVVIGQSIVLSEIKTEVLLENDDPAYQSLVLQQYEERIERLSQQDKASKFCIDAGFIHVVEIGQYFMTKDTGEQFMQWPVVNTLQEMMDHHNRKDGFRERQKMDPHWKLRPVACIVNTELKSEFGH